MGYIYTIELFIQKKKKFVCPCFKFQKTSGKVELDL